MDDLKGRVIRSGLARLVGQGTNFILRIGSVVILARLLDPEDFGLMAMVTVVTGIYSLFATGGLSLATVQKATISDEQISTLFWVNLLIGGVLAFLCVATAPVLVAFYHEPRLLWVTVAVAAAFLFNSAGVQHYALLERSLRYVALTVIEATSQLMGVAVAVTTAIAGFGYWALVATAVVTPAVGTTLMWLTTRWVPGPPRRNSGVRSMLRFGGTVTLNGLVVYVAYNFDKVLLGRFWGADVLGLYGRAYQLVNIPTENLNTAIGGVAFSALSRLQEDPARLKSYFLKGYSLVISLTIPITIFCALSGNDIVLLLLGSKWTEAAVVFRLLTPTVLIFGMINPIGWLLTSIGLQWRSLMIACVIAPLVLTAYVIGLPYGPKGVAFAFSTAMTLWLVPHIVWCLHGTMISPRDLLLAVSRPFLSGVVAAGVAMGVQAYSSGIPSTFLRIMLAGSIMVGVYVFMLLIVMGQRTFYRGLFDGLKSAVSTT
jgi:PST family polysaccharide transporter